MTLTTRAVRIPESTVDPNLRALGTEIIDRVTGETDTTFDLSAPPVLNTVLLFKNGVLLDPDAGTPAYTISGLTVTLNVAAIAGDVFHIKYRPRLTR